MKKIFIIAASIIALALASSCRGHHTCPTYKETPTSLN
jgi:hypothetical protein